MSNTNNSNTNGDSGHSEPKKQEGWAYPWGYHLPCFREANKTVSHQCASTKQFGNFVVNEKASHFED